MPNTAVAIDTGPLVALFDKNDNYHIRAVAFVSDCHRPLFTTLASVTESMHLLRFDRIAQRGLIKWIGSGAISVENATLDDLSRVNELMDKYADRPMDFADSLLVAICERKNITDVATVDRDFEIYRLKGRGKFRNLF